jgi:cell division protein FtsL
MNELFFTFLFFAIGSLFIVVIQAMTIVLLTKWNRELKRENAYLQPPF